MADNQTVLTSGLGKINWRDLLNGAFNAALGAVGGIILSWTEVLQTPGADPKEKTLNWTVVAILAGVAFLQHIIRKLLSPQVVVVTDPTPQQLKMVKTGDAKVQISKAA